MISTTRRGLLALVLITGSAAAQDNYPSRPIQMVVPYPPGGNTDLMARALQTELTRALGQTVVIVNRGGAAGTIGDAQVARAAPDGYTIGMSPNNPLTAQPHLMSLTYAMDSFRFLCLVYDNPQVLVLGRNAPFRDFAGMVAHARSAKEALVYGSPGQGSTQHILTAALLKALGVEGLHVPFTGAGADVAGSAWWADPGLRRERLHPRRHRPAGTGDVQPGAHAEPAAGPDADRTRPPDRGKLRRRAGRPGRDARRRRRGDRARLRHGRRQRQFPAGCRTAELRATPSAGRGLPRPLPGRERHEPHGAA
jgi:hypothetical protein